MNFAMTKNEDSIKHSKSAIVIGSSVIGLKFNKGIIIACDTRLNYGSSLDLQFTKERIKLVNNTTLIGYSGEFSDLQETSRILESKVLKDHLDTKGNQTLGPVEIANFLAGIHYDQRRELDPFLNSAIIGGIDFNGDIVLFQTDPYGIFLKGNYFTTSFANYFCCALLRNEYPKDPKDITKERAIELIKKCFEVLFYRDSYAGDKIQIVVMEKDDNINNPPKIEENIITLETKWEYAMFKQGNEKSYLIP